jgi:hypothetical protein
MHQTADVVDGGLDVAFEVNEELIGSICVLLPAISEMVVSS